MARLGYVIVFVDDMAAGIAFYRDVVGFELRFQTPDWSELSTGETTLALHKASPESPAGTVKLGVQVSDLDSFQEQLRARGTTFVRPIREQHGQRLAEFRDPWGGQVSVSSPAKP